MIDIHSHILPNVDDGSSSMEESIIVIKEASKMGVTDIVVTPHFILGSNYNMDNSQKQMKLLELKEELKNRDIKVNIYLGNEVFAENNMTELILKNQITTLNNTKYLLFELPMNNSYNGINDLIFNLKVEGFQPIIAHPERYMIFKNNPSLIHELLLQGVLFQSNIGSFLGYYGKEAKELAFLFLKHNMIHFIGSDIHHEKTNFYNKINELKTILLKCIPEDELDDLFINNARLVLNNEEINKKEYISLKKNMFGKWK